MNYNPPNNIEGNQGPGRPKGSPNKSTAEIRECLKMLVANQLPYLEEALNKVREKDPGKYVSLLTRLNELVLPKMQQVELTNENGLDINATVIEMKKKLEFDNK